MDERIRLRPDVSCVPLPRGQLMFVARDGVSLRVSTGVQPIVEPLVSGATFVELATALRARHPQAAMVEEKLMAFVGQLAQAGLLEGGASSERRPELRRVFVDPDPLLRPLARLVGALPAPLGRLIVATLGLLAIGQLALAVQRSALHVGSAAAEISLVGVALFVAIALPLHELAHGIAARVAGVPVRELGLLLAGSVLPRPYVRTPDAVALRSRSARAGIALAGPLSDLLVAGACAHLAPDHPTARGVMLLALLALAIGTSPLREGDGSHALECLLGDPFARRSALTRRRSRLTAPQIVRAYRLACVAHTTVVALAIWRLW